MAAGYTVRISETGKPYEDWAVAVSDRNAAMIAALLAAGAPPDTSVRILNELSQADLNRIGLAPGKARKV
jgi:hypothetical protein